MSWDRAGSLKGAVAYAKTGLVSNSSGVATVTLPAAGLAIAISPRTSGVTWSVSTGTDPKVAVVTFLKIKSMISVALLGANVNLFDAPGAVTFDLIATVPTT